MSELIKRQDAIDAVEKAYRYESERMTALQEVPVITEEEFRNKAIDDFAELLSKICENNGMSINRDNGRPLYAENGVWYDLISETAKQLKNKPDCFISNEEPYPLCKGNGDEKCHNCCIYEDYEKYHSPYND